MFVKYWVLPFKMAMQIFNYNSDTSEKIKNLQRDSYFITYLKMYHK